MLANADTELTRMVRSQIGRRSVDASLLDIRVSHGIVYLRGVLRTIRTHAEMDLMAEMQHISTILKQKAGIREVVWEVVQRH